MSSFLFWEQTIDELRRVELLPNMGESGGVMGHVSPAMAEILDLSAEWDLTELDDAATAEGGDATRG